jgi:predicted dehydrogenase
VGEPRGVGIVGLGIGLAHVHALRRLRDDFRIVAVCDVDNTKAADVAGRIGADVASFESMLERYDVDVVAVCTPPHLHRAQAEQALAAGKHCVCEKPLAGSLADVDALAATAERAHCRLMPIFNYRYGQGYQRLKLLVDRGIAGRLYAAHMDLAWRRRADYYVVPWRGAWATELGGVLVSHAVHGIDAFVSILGSPRNVTARTTTLVNPVETDDTAVAILEYPDGGLVTINATLGSAREFSRHRFSFANLSAESGTDPYNFTDEEWTFTGDSPEATAAIDGALAGFEPGAGGWIGQYEGFARALDAGVPPPVTIADARATLEVVTALYVSSREGRTVTLPFPAGHPAYHGWQP